MRLFGRRSREPRATALGLLLSPHSLTLARLSPDADAVRLLDLQTREFPNLDAAGKPLQQLCDSQSLLGEPVNICLSADFYRLHQTDNPNVPPAERNAALAWALRDVLDFPATEAAVDSFAPPTIGQRSGTERLFVAVSQKARLKPLVDLVLAAGLQIRAIDIPELCARNLLLRLSPALNSAALLMPGARHCTLCIYHGNELVVARQLTGITDLRLLFSGIDNSQAQEQLLLEIQRTLDYYESQIARRPVARLLLPPMTDELAGLLPLLRDNLGVGIAPLDLPTLVPMAETIDHTQFANGWLAIGAALRKEVTDATN